jgi:hypothetical protein
MSTVRYVRLRQRGSGRFRPAARPFDVLRSLGRSLKRQRGIAPSPITYAAPTLAGAAAGWVLRRGRRRGAWVPVVALPSTVWVIATATAFTHGRARQTVRELRLQASLALHPDQAADRMRRENESRIRSCSLPLYGLPASWEGPRWWGGWGEGEKGVNHVTLVHGDQEDRPGPFVRVGVSSAPAFEVDDQLVRSMLVRELRARRARPPAPPPSPPPPLPRTPRDGKEVAIWAVTVGSSPADYEELPDPPQGAWRSVSIRLDAEAVPFTYLEEGAEWVAWTRLGDIELQVRSRAYPVEQVELVRVSDLEPYLAGSREQLN